MRHIWLLLIIASVLLVSACAAPAAPAEDAAAESAAVDNVTADSSDCEELPEELSFPVDRKAPLRFSTLDVELEQMIAFTFPDGLVALKAAGLPEYSQIDSEFFIVGLVELVDTPYYEVAIDLVSEESMVTGLLIPSDGSDNLDVLFERKSVDLNPEREEDTPPLVSVSIASNQVCYVVEVDRETRFFQYCSMPDMANGSLLSVRNTFPEAYEQLVGDMIEIAESFDLEVWAGDTISEIEDPNHILECANANECGADIVGAPVRGFEEELQKSFTQLAAGICPSYGVDAGVVHVWRELPAASVLPGEYKVTFWFDYDGFAGATITGTTDGGESIENQRIPAVPATFLGGHSVSLISAWRLWGWCCWWQYWCP